MDWIDEALERQAFAETSYRKEIERRQYEDGLRSAGGAHLFSALVETVQKRIDDYNQKIKNRERRLQSLEPIGKNGYRTERKYEPYFLLNFEFHPEVPRVDYSYVRPSAIDGNLYKESGTFGFYLQSNLEVVLCLERSPITIEDAAKVLLLPAVEMYIPVA